MHMHDICLYPSGLWLVATCSGGEASRHLAINLGLVGEVLGGGREVGRALGKFEMTWVSAMSCKHYVFFLFLKFIFTYFYFIFCSPFWQWGRLVALRCPRASFPIRERACPRGRQIRLPASWPSARSGQGLLKACWPSGLDEMWASLQSLL